MVQFIESGRYHEFCDTSARLEKVKQTLKENSKVGRIGFVALQEVTKSITEQVAPDGYKSSYQVIKFCKITFPKAHHLAEPFMAM